MLKRSELYEMLYLIGASSIALNTIRAQILEEGADKTLDEMIKILERGKDNVVFEGIAAALASSLRGIMEGVATSAEYLQELRTPQCLLEVMPTEGKLVDPAERSILVALIDPSRNQRLLKAAVRRCSMVSVDDGFYPILLTLILNVINVAGISAGYIDEFERWVAQISHGLDGDKELLDIVHDILSTIDSERSNPVVTSLQI